MPTYTLRIDEEKDQEYFNKLKSLMIEFGHKSATDTFKKSVLERGNMENSIKQLKNESLRLSNELREYKYAVREYTNAKDSLFRLAAQEPVI